MDGDGTWHNAHGKLEHPKIIQYFNRSIQKDGQGYFLSHQIDDKEEKVYFPFEDTAVFVVDVKIKKTSIDLILNTFSGLALDPEQLYIKNDSLFMATPDHLVKFSQNALAKLFPAMVETDSGLAVKLGKKNVIIRSE